MPVRLHFLGLILTVLMTVAGCKMALSDQEHDVSVSPLGDGVAAIAGDASDIEVHEAMPVILSMETKKNDETVRSISILSTQVDPNVMSVDDRFSLQIDGKIIEDVPQSILQKLSRERRSYSYDAQSGGIKEHPQPGVMCMLGGPSMGRILYTKYLSYDQNYILQDSVLKPVYSRGDNCLFVKKYSPVDERSVINAAEALAVLTTLQAIYAK